MGAKSFFAFRFTMEMLTDEMPDLYFWTFTFKDVICVDEACKRWNRGKMGLTNAFPSTAGIRVFEMHPGGRDGFSHGMHIHAVINEWWSVDVVRAIWDRVAGAGSRIQVSKIGKGKAFYIGKYLRKGKREPALAGKRLWATFGMAETTRCQDIVVQNEWTEAYKFLNASIGGFKDMPWPMRLKLAKDFSHGIGFEANLERFGYELHQEQGQTWGDGTPYHEHE